MSDTDNKENNQQSPGRVSQAAFATMLPDSEPKDLNAVALVRVDRFMIREALSNVNMNMVQAMPVSGVQTLSTRATGIVSELTITDTGVAIEKERLDHTRLLW